MKKTILFIVLALLCLILRVTAQDETVPIGLKVGDQVPDITINNIINYKSTTGQSITATKLSDFKDKLLILDFWATYCSSCIVNLPHLEALNNRFKNKLLILAVTDESPVKILNFLRAKRDPKGKKYDFPSVVGDTVLKRIFPHQLIPHYVWIGKTGKVLAITSTEEVNELVINRLLEDKQGQIQTKADIDSNKPLFLSANYPGDNQLLNYCILSKGSYGGLGSGSNVSKQGKIIYRQAVTNSPLLTIFETAVRHLFHKQNDSYNPKRLILQVQSIDEVRHNLSDKKDGSFSTANFYNFDLQVPASRADSLYQQMLTALNTYSDYTGSIERRSVRCLVLKTIGKSANLKSKGEASINTLFFGHPAVLRNLPISLFVARLNDENTINMPVVDETNYRGNVDMNFTGATDISTLNRELQKYNLKLIDTERNINMFILRDKVPKNNYNN